MLLSLGRDGVRHAAMVTILKPGSSFYGAAPDRVLEICRRIYEAAALPCPGRRYRPLRMKPMADQQTTS
jgi:hypothetical protein